MSGKERVVFLDRAAFSVGELPIQPFDHNWSEYPGTEAADVMPRLIWVTTAIMPACPLDAEVIGQLQRLKRMVVAGRPAVVDVEAYAARGIAVRKLPAHNMPDMPEEALINLLEGDINAD